MASGGPIRLVECSWQGNIRVNPEAVRILSRLPPPLRVVSIFGPRQSGKSYLLDVLAGSTGFAASRGDSPDDLRINMWTLPDTEDPGHTLVLLDTEGFEEDLGIEHAAFTCPIFTLSLLLSSVFLYNTWGPVSTDALDQLLHVTMLANQVSLPAISWAGESLLPQFVWCVRDYDLDVAMGDVELMPEDFLDSVFNDAKGLQSPAGLVCKLFARERMEIFDFCHPQNGAETLEGVPLSELEPRFTRQAKALKKSICGSDPKVLQDCRALSGSDLGDILKQFVDSLSRGSVIQLDSVIGESSRAENAQDLDLPRDCEVPTTEVLPRYTEVPREVQGPVVEREMPLREAPARPHRESSATGTADRIPVGIHPVDMDRPVCLIENTSAGELQVNQESLDILRSIQQPVVVVSIVGLYRTGKSYLMNRLAGKKTGFSLGSTVQSETKGIWMWCVPHPHRDDQTLVLLDTEGLGDVEKGDQKNDTWIFSLAVLLSSTLVYNSMGTINNEAVMSLHYVTELTKHIKVKSTKEETEDESSYYARFFPTFVWAVRDFTLELEIDGKAVTADEYLENSLRPKNASSKAVALSNEARECIRNYFLERKCFVFDQPGSKEKLKLLDQLADSELDPQFMKQTSDFCGYIFSCSKAKTVKSGITATGSLLGGLAVTYVDAIRSGSVPCLENAVAALSKIENSAAVEESFALYRQLLGERVKLHTKDQKELSSAHDGCLKEALQLFMKHSFKDEDQKYQTALMERVKEVYEKKCAENEEMSRKHCAALLLQLEQRMDMGPVEAYMKPGGYQEFNGQLNKLVKLYKNKPSKGLKAEEALANYLSEKNRMGKIILTTDEKMSEQQRQLKEQRAQVEEEKQRAAAAREQQEVLERRMNDVERAHQENERQLMERMERDREELQRNNQQLMERMERDREEYRRNNQQLMERMERDREGLERNNQQLMERMERDPEGLERNNQQLMERMARDREGVQTNNQQLMERIERDREGLQRNNLQLMMLCARLAERSARPVERIEIHERIVETSSCVLS